MKARELSALLEKHPEAEVKIQVKGFNDVLIGSVESTAIGPNIVWLMCDEDSEDDE